MGLDPKDKDIDIGVPVMLERAVKKAMGGFLSSACWDLSSATVLSLCGNEDALKTYGVITSDQSYTDIFGIDIVDDDDEDEMVCTLNAIVMPIFYAYIHADCHDDEDPHSSYIRQMTRALFDSVNMDRKILSYSISQAMATVGEKAPTNDGLERIKDEFVSIMGFDEDGATEFMRKTRFWDKDNLANTYDEILSCIHVALLKANVGDIGIDGWHRFLIVVREEVPAYAGIKDTEEELNSLGIGPRNNFGPVKLSFGMGVTIDGSDE